MINITKPDIHIIERAILLGIFLLASMNSIHRTYYGVSKQQAFDCSGFLSLYAPKFDFGMNTRISIALAGNGSGFMTLDGIVQKNDVETRLSRDVTFSWDRINNSMIQLHDVKFFHIWRDNTPDELIEAFFYSLRESATPVMTINKLNNDFVVGTPRGPSYICHRT